MMGEKKLSMNVACFFVAAMYLFFFCPLDVFGGSDSGKDSAVIDLDIEQLMGIEVETVYGASKFEQKVTQAPSSVSIVTAEDIKRYGWRTLAEVLKSVAGFYISYDREYARIGSRGFSQFGDINSRILLLVDGHRTNDLALQLAVVDDGSLIDIDLVERIEIIRGPGSSLYGSNAVLGTINIITRKPRDMNGMEISGELGTFDTYKERISYGKELSNGLSFLLSASQKKSHGQSLYFKEYDNPGTNNGWAEGCDSGKFENYFANISYKGFTLTAAYAGGEKELPVSRAVTFFNDDENRHTLDRGYLDLKYVNKIGPNTELTARLYYNYGAYGTDAKVAFPLPYSFELDGHEKWWGGSAELTTTVWDKHKLVLGFDYEDTQTLELRISSPIPVQEPAMKGSYLVATHIQDQFTIMDNLIVNAGIRYDHYKLFGDVLNPRLGIIYNPRKTTTLKFLYGQAFRTPNAFELYWSDGGYTSKSNPDLDPETIETYEIILEEYFRNYRATVSGFYYRIRNLIGQTVDPMDGLYVYQNLGIMESKGVELEIQGKWRGGIESKLSYTFQQAMDDSTGRTAINSPKHLVKFNLYVPIIKERFSAGMEAQYIGPRRTRDGHTGGAFTANMTILGKEIIKGLDVSGGIYNIFDKYYSDPVSGEYRQYTVPQDGRTFRIKCTYRF